MNKKVLFSSFELPKLLKNSNLPAGGVSTELVSWINGFQKNGNEVALLSFKNANNYIGRKLNFEILETFDPKEGFPKIRLLYKQLPSFYKKIKVYNPDFVFQEGSNLRTLMLAISSKMLKVKFVHRIASDMDVDKRITSLISPFEAYMYRLGVKMADHISCQNEFQYNAIRKKYPNKGVSISHNPFEIKKKLERRERNYIAWIGNFRNAKNLPALAEVAAKLPQYKFRIAGGNFEKTDADAEAGLEKLRRLENVEFVGYINNREIRDFLSEAYILLNTSRTEGFSNTFLEAWSAGTPVITTENVNPDDLIRKHNLGAVADNYKDLPELINNFISAKKYEDLSENCYKYVVQYHDPEKLAKDMLNKINREE